MPHHFRRSINFSILVRLKHGTNLKIYSIPIKFDHVGRESAKELTLVDSDDDIANKFSSLGSKSDWRFSWLIKFSHSMIKSYFT